MSYPQDPSKQGGDPAYPPGHYPPPQYSHQLMQGGAPVGMHPHAQQYTYAQQGHMPQQYAYAQGYPGQQQPSAPPPYAYQQPMQHVQGYPVQAGYPQQYMQQMPQMYQVSAPAQFDSGARFDGIAGQNIPPPPPGCAANAAQIATAQGGTVHATQKKDNWFSGGKGGGMSFW